MATATVFFSDRECACGCGNLLPRTIADRGWRYIRGHKPAAPAKDNSKILSISSTNPRKMLEFFDAELENIERQEKAMEARHRALNAELGQVRDALDQLRRDSAATRKLRDEVSAHFKGKEGSE